jgi:hypothetical protein
MSFEKGTEAYKLRKNVGRKTAREEAEKILKLDLANQIGNEELTRIKQTPMYERNREDLDKIVMPIILKAMANKIDLPNGLNINFDDSFNSPPKTKGDNSK